MNAARSISCTREIVPHSDVNFSVRATVMHDIHVRRVLRRIVHGVLVTACELETFSEKVMRRLEEGDCQHHISKSTDLTVRGN